MKLLPNCLLDSSTNIKTLLYQYFYSNIINWTLIGLTLGFLNEFNVINPLYSFKKTRIIIILIWDYKLDYF